MNVSDMMSEIVDAGYGDVTAIRQVSYINDTLWDITNREKWPFREKNLGLLFNGVSDVATNWPSDFSQVVWVYDTVLGDAVWPERVETIRDRYANTLSSTSQNNLLFAYFFINKTAHFYPIPVNDNGTPRYFMDYVAQQPALTSSSLETDIMLPLQFHRAVVAGTLYKLAMLFDDTDIAPMYQAEYENKLMQMREELLRRQYQRPDQIYVVDESDEWDNTPFLP
jgi:hypothetical protein